MSSSARLVTRVWHSRRIEHVVEPGRRGNPYALTDVACQQQELAPAAVGEEFRLAVSETKSTGT